MRPLAGTANGRRIFHRRGLRRRRRPRDHFYPEARGRWSFALLLNAADNGVECSSPEGPNQEGEFATSQQLRPAGIGRSEHPYRARLTFSFVVPRGIETWDGEAFPTQCSPSSATAAYQVMSRWSSAGRDFFLGYGDLLFSALESHVLVDDDAALYKGHPFDWHDCFGNRDLLFS